VCCAASSRERFVITSCRRAGKTHHPEGGRNAGSGGPITISASTLAEGQIAAAVRYKSIRSSQFDDAALLAATAQGKHWGSIRSIESVSLSAACGRFA
jgi:hypothetical protein